jgi:hypothetical protein
MDTIGYSNQLGKQQVNHLQVFFGGCNVGNPINLINISNNRECYGDFAGLANKIWEQ